MDMLERWWSLYESGAGYVASEYGRTDDLKIAIRFGTAEEAAKYAQVLKSAGPLELQQVAVFKSRLRRLPDFAAYRQRLLYLQARIDALQAERDQIHEQLQEFGAVP